MTFRLKCREQVMILKTGPPQESVKGIFSRGGNGHLKAGTRWEVSALIHIAAQTSGLFKIRQFQKRWSLFQRYFVLEGGILRYSKNQQDVSEILCLSRQCKDWPFKPNHTTSNPTLMWCLIYSVSVNNLNNKLSYHFVFDRWPEDESRAR